MSPGCSSGGCCFFFDDAGDWVIATSVVTADVVSFVRVAFADDVVFASAIVTVVMVVAVDDLTGDLFLPPLRVTWVHLFFWWGVPSFRICAIVGFVVFCYCYCGFCCCLCCCRSGLFLRQDQPSFWKTSIGPPAVNDHHHRLISVCYGMGDGLKLFPI